MAVLSALAVAVAAGLDLATGEPPDRVHPVAWFGRAVAPVDRSWPHPRAAGVLAAAVMPLAAAALVAGLVGAVAAWRPPAGVGLAGVVLFVATSLRRLLAVAREVTAATKRDLPRAREDLRALAGRDANDLSAGEVRSAVVESLAENLADGLVAPLGAFALGAALGARLPAATLPGGVAGVTLAGSTATALALGSAGAVWTKAVNTMDSMLGYRSKPVGWGAARLDDAVMWLPARTTAILLAAVCLAPGSLVRAREWVDGVPSPNSGWPMGVLAAALGVSLVKPGAYELPGGSDLPSVADADSARRRVAAAGGLAYLLAGVVAWG
jgi:adenosylcobinamide-phosphate synthase